MPSIRRSRAAGGLLAAALLIAASGCGADGPEDLTLPPATDRADVTGPTEPAPPTTTPTEEMDSAPTDSPQMAESAATPANAPFDTSMDDPDFVPVQWLVPWDDGFLAVGVRHPPQPLPDQLPPEIAELFPPEVVALFPDGLPPTQQEAMAMLEEAGLFDAVMDVLNEHPEAMDALQSVQRPDAEPVASWSADGDEWITTDMALPDGFGDLSQLVVSGDRLTTAGSTMPADPTEPWVVTVASTTDLQNWTTESFEIAAPDGLSEDEQLWVAPIAVAANDEHWAARTLVDVSTPFPTSDVPTPRMELWSGSWDDSWGGEPTMTTDNQSFGQLTATSAGLVDVGAGVAFSPDGRTWTEVDPPKPDLWFQAAAPMGDQVVTIAATPDGETSIHLLDVTDMTWSDVEVPGLDGTFSAWNWSSGPAFIVETNMPPPTTQTVVVEHDGFELTLAYGVVAAYRLVDVSTGDVVAEESVDQRVMQASYSGPFEHLTEDARGVTITDPGSGDVIVQIPGSVMAHAWQEASRSDSDAFEDYEPDLWLLATTDGQTWLFEDLDEGDHDDSGMPQLVAANGSTALVGAIGWEPDTAVWQRFTITE